MYIIMLICLVVVVLIDSLCKHFKLKYESHVKITYIINYHKAL